MVNKYPNYQIDNLDLLTYAGNLENLKDIENTHNYKFVKGDIAELNLSIDFFKKKSLIMC